MELTGALQEQLNDALRSAFHRQDRLDRLLRHKLDRRLNDYTGGGPYPRVVQDVIDAAVAESWWMDLLAQAREENPGNEKLRAFAETVAALEPARVDLEQIVRTTNSMLDPAQWRAILEANEARVCRIDVGDPSGTGFLVARDVVMTCQHVIRGAAGADDVTLRFDYKRNTTGGAVGSLRATPLAEDWLISASAEPDLDFALLRLKEPIGGERIGPRRQRRARGWIGLPAAPPELKPGATLLILQHAKGSELKLGIETNSVIGLTAHGTRLRHRTNTLRGSSGSPCFDQNWRPVALHCSAMPAEDPSGAHNMAVPLRAIVAELRQRGLGHLVDE